MSRRTHLLLLVSPVVILSIGASALSAAPVGDIKSSQLATYDTPSGENGPEMRFVVLQDADAAVPAADGGGGGMLGAFIQDEGEFLNLVEDNQQVLKQKMQSEVEQELNEARDEMGQNPDGAKRNLKLLLETVERSPDLDPETRAQLRDQVASAIREAGRRSIEVATRRAMAEENRAASEERQRLVEETARTRLKIKQMMARFNSLMDEQRFGDAEDIIAQEVRELDPLGTTPVSAVWNARFGGHVHTLVRLREVRHRNFARALLEVEKALVPFPGDPPIMYPDPQIWADKSLRRKKYASIDLAQQKNWT